MVKDIEYLHKSWIEHQQQNNLPRKGSFAVRLLPYAPSFRMLAFDAPQVNGIVFIEIYSHKGGFKSPPMFSLTSQRDGEWYEYFVTQFEEMWEEAKPWEPPPLLDRF